MLDLSRTADHGIGNGKLGRAAANGGPGGLVSGGMLAQGAFRYCLSAVARLDRRHLLGQSGNTWLRFTTWPRRRTRLADLELGSQASQSRSSIPGSRSPQCHRNAVPNLFPLRANRPVAICPKYILPKVGLEPTRSCEDRILSPVRLPFPWYWKHVGATLKASGFRGVTIQDSPTYIRAALG